jgi:hypothetical protein
MLKKGSKNAPKKHVETPTQVISEERAEEILKNTESESITIDSSTSCGGPDSIAIGTGAVEKVPTLVSMGEGSFVLNLPSQEEGDENLLMVMSGQVFVNGEPATNPTKVFNAIIRWSEETAKQHGGEETSK